MPPLRGAGEHSLVGARRLLMMRRHNARFDVTLPGRRIVPRHRVAGFRRAFLAYLQSLLLLDASCPGSPVFRAFSTLSFGRFSLNGLTLRGIVEVDERSLSPLSPHSSLECRETRRRERQRRVRPLDGARSATRDDSTFDFARTAREIELRERDENDRSTESEIERRV